MKPCDIPGCIGLVIPLLLPLVFIILYFDPPIRIKPRDILLFSGFLRGGVRFRAGIGLGGIRRC
jgi:hypothetical protein